jgi:hypothetical protein
MVIFLLAFAFVGLTQAAPDAQIDQPPSTLAPIVRTERAAAGVVRIVYDLSGAAGTLVTVSLEVSNDSGRTFDIVPRALAGDVGAGVSPGGEKTIVWDTTKDVEDLQIDRYVFRVRLLRSASAAAPGSPIAGNAARPPAGRGAPPATPGSGGTAVAARKGGGLSKGAIAALVGGGAAAGVGVAVSKGKGGGSPTTPVSPSRTFTAAISGPMAFQFSICRRVETWTGTLVLRLDISSSGNVTGSASASVSTLVDSLTPVANCPQQQVGGTGTVALPLSQVTGTTSRFVFSGKATSGPTAAGDKTDDWSFTGSLVNDVITGTLDWSVTFAGLPGSSGGLGTARFNVSAR